MFKKINLLVLCVFALGFLSLAQSAPNTDVSIEATMNSSFSKMSASLFENDKAKDNLTEKLKTGFVVLRWETSLTDSPIMVRYRQDGAEKWITSKVIPAGTNEYKVEGLNENEFFEWSLGSGTEWTKPIEFQTLGMHLFENFTAKAGAERMTLTWSIDYSVAAKLKDRDIQAIVTYQNDIAKRRAKKGIEGSGWLYTPSFSLLDKKIEIENLNGHDKYEFKIGFAPTGSTDQLKNKKDQMVWSGKVKKKTERGWGVAKFLLVIGSLAFFIFGMKLMSEGLQQAAGSRLRAMLGSMTSNRVKGVLTGFGITSIVQSSSVTSVMTVSFVNAGLMSLRQSAGVMMGANVGTTITAWIIVLLGFKLSIGDYAYMLIALAAPLLFISKGKSKAWVTAIFGFCILFIGLGVLKDSVPELDASSSIVQFFIDFKDAWYGPVMFVMLGALVTMVIQSSSAAMALTLTMVATGTLPFDVACAMVLGENIGTTITAQLASLIANVHAKRAAAIHTIFNVVGVVWMLLIFHFFLDGLAWLVTGDPYTDTAVAATAIALFHTLFNVLNVFFLIWFVPQLVSLAERSVRSKGESDEEFHLDFISGPLGSTSELCILEAKKEVAKFGHITSKMNSFVDTFVNSSDRKEKNKMLRKIEKYEEITDRVELEIATYLGKTAQMEMSSEASTHMRGMLNITTDLERIGDIFFQMSKTLEKKDSDKVYFTPEQRNGLNSMLKIVDNAFDVMNENLNAEYGSITMDKAIAKEREIDQMRDQLREEQHRQIGTGTNIENGMVFSNLFYSLEKVGDHIINVSEHVAGVNLN
ncbi:MAG: Na/Pi cotransporter family protein [Flavobacteriales bacterium]|nr:Na/Pi cotransporter family protein [Flavobacteriales bacterium]